MTKQRGFWQGILFMMAIGLVLISLLAPAQASSAKGSATPRPSPSATTTALPNLQLPAWVRDPHASIVPLEADGGFVLLNAETGERFPLKLPYIDQVKWTVSSDAAYLELIKWVSSGRENSNGFVETVRLDTGALVRYDLNDFRIPSNRPTVPPPVDNGSGITYQMVAQAEWASGATGKYQLLTHKEIILTDTKTGRKTSVYADPQGQSELISLSVQWFGNGRFLGVAETRNDGLTSTIYDDGHGLTHNAYIWDANGVNLDNFGNRRQVRFSPVDSLMLYRDNTASDKICLRDITKTVESDCKSLEHSLIQDYEWSQDGQKIIFTYTEADGKSGGLCVADVKNGASPNCLMNPSVKTGTYSGHYSYQRGNNYGVFTYGNLEPHDVTGTIREESGLCLVSQKDYSVNCITDKLVPDTSYFDAMYPSHSGTVLAFSYAKREIDDEDGVCIVNLQSGSVNCPASDTHYVDQVSWSPNNRCLLIMWSTYNPDSDDKSFTYYGTYNVTAGTYRDEGSALYEHTLDQLWRPALSK